MFQIINCIFDSCSTDHGLNLIWVKVSSAVLTHVLIPKLLERLSSGRDFSICQMGSWHSRHTKVIPDLLEVREQLPLPPILLWNGKGVAGWLLSQTKLTFKVPLAPFPPFSTFPPVSYLLIWEIMSCRQQPQGGLPFMWLTGLP